jgi:glutathione S-transferase
VAPGNAVGAAQVKAAAETKIAGLLDQLDAEVARHGQGWFMGAHYSALDAYVFTLCRWTRNLSSVPARARPHLGPYLQRMLARPAPQRVLAVEQLAPPFV